jgi:glycosyltransferase involved in cell wall biosynthesis
VLFINHTAQLGGGELALLSLISSIDVTSVESSIVLFEDGPLRKLLEPYACVLICRLSTRVLSARKDSLSRSLWPRMGDLASTLGFLTRLMSVVRKSGADVVHTNSLKADILGGVASRLSGIPVIWHVRDRIADDYLPGLVVKAFRWLARVIPHYVIANSYATLSTLLNTSSEQRGRDTGDANFRLRSSVIHDGVREAASASNKIPRNLIVVGLVGRISPWKGQHVFVRAAAKVHAKFPNAIFRIIGAPLFGEDAYSDSLHKICLELGIAASVEFTGFVRDVSGAIADLDILVHASTIAEPFGQVIIEGMAAGKPVVATNGGGVLEIVVDQITGYLVPMNDEFEMAEAIMKLVDKPLQRKVMGAKGKMRADRLFRIESTAEGVQDVYASVLKLSCSI